MKFPKLSELEIDDSWAVAEGNLEGKPMLVRIRQNLRYLAGHPQLMNRLRIVWEYELANDSGFPTPEDNLLLQNCEDLLVSAFEKYNHAILTHVITCDGLRQWVFYSSDIQESAQRINNVLPHDNPFPIELSVDPDSDWEEYLDTLQSLDL